MIVINLFAGPGCGKSTVAAETFSYLKRNNIKVELVTEYAKDLVYEKRFNVLQDQLYIFAKQNRRLLRLLNEDVDVAITDSPLLLSAIYYKINNGKSKHFTELVKEVFSSYNNINFFLNRNVNYNYQQYGRLQDYAEALELDNKIKKLLLSYEKQTIEANEHICIENDDNTTKVILKEYIKVQQSYNQ